MWLLAAAGASAQSKDIEPDRPDVTNGTHIVDTGLLQFEVGGIFTRPTQGQREFGTPFTARLGLRNWLEVRVGGDGWLSQNDAAGPESGFGNVQLGAKVRLWEDPGGIPVLSILPTINIPTASADKDLGSGGADYTLVLLTGTDVGTRGHVDVNYGIGAIAAGGGAPHFLQQAASISASLAASSKWNPYVEAFWFSRDAPDEGATTALDAGAIYTVSPRLALDGGLQVGMSQAAPDFAAFAGVSVVVGEILGGHGVHSRQRRTPKRTANPPKRK